MEPNIKDDDVLLTEHVSVRMNRLSRGDVIITRSPMNPLQYICKRIRAVPGDKLIQTDGTFLYVCSLCHLAVVVFLPLLKSVLNLMSS